MLIGYIRPSKGGQSVTAQRDALRAAGVADDRAVYIEELPNRRHAKTHPDDLGMRAEVIRCVRSGDVVVVSGFDRLGLTVADILSCINAICQRGGAILDASTGETHRWHPDATSLVAVAAHAERTLMQERTSRAREAAAEMGAKGGRPNADPVKLDTARRLWADPELSGSAIAKLTGLGLRTLYQHLGPRSETKEKKRSKLE